MPEVKMLSSLSFRRSPTLLSQWMQRRCNSSLHITVAPPRSFSSQAELPPLYIARDEVYGTGPSLGTIIIAHATGFCHNVWDPTVKYMENMLTEAGKSLRIVGFDWSGHGGSHLRAPYSDMRNWGLVTPRDVAEVVSHVRNTGTGAHSPLFSVGHSFGGAGVMLTELKNPGLFRAIISFEPIIMPVRGMTETHSWVDSPMALKAEKRREFFPSYDEAKAYFSSRQFFAKWHQDAFNGYIRCGLIPVEGDASGPVRLACKPSTEADMYRGWHNGYDLIESIKCPVTIAVGSNTQFEMRYGQSVDIWKEIAGRLEKGKMEIVQDSTHFMVMEQPKHVAEIIIKTIQENS